MKPNIMYGFFGLTTV